MKKKYLKIFKLCPSDLLHNFLELSMTSLCPERGTIDVLVDHYQNVVPIFVEHAIEIQRMDFLFVDMYDKLKSDSIAKGVFLEVFIWTACWWFDGLIILRFSRVIAVMSPSFPHLLNSAGPGALHFKRPSQWYFSRGDEGFDRPLRSSGNDLFHRILHSACRRRMLGCSSGVWCLHHFLRLRDGPFFNLKLYPSNMLNHLLSVTQVYFLLHLFSVTPTFPG